MRFRTLFALTLILAILAVVAFFTYDKMLVLWVASHTFPLVMQIGRLVQLLFGVYLWLPLTLVMLIYLWWKHNGIRPMFHHASTAFWVGIFLTMLISAMIKFSVGRYRPELFLQKNDLFGFIGFVTQRHFDPVTSMPSDHTAVIFAIVTALCLKVRAIGLRIIFCVLGLALASFRVLYLKHYPSDVLIGIVVGMWGMSLAFALCNIRSK